MAGKAEKAVDWTVDMSLRGSITDGKAFANHPRGDASPFGMCCA
jgi:hypothetical protein